MGSAARPAATRVRPRASPGPTGPRRGLPAGIASGDGHLRRVAQVPLGVQRGLAAGAGRGDRLAVGVVDEVAGREHAGPVRAGRLALGDDVAARRRVSTWPATSSRLRLVADRDERAGHRQLARLARCRGCARAAWPSAPSSPADELLDHVRGEELDVAELARALEHDLRGAELVATVHDRHLGRELRQEDRLLHRGVAAADDDRLAVLEERRVARRAVGHAATAELPPRRRRRACGARRPSRAPPCGRGTPRRPRGPCGSRRARRRARACVA